ncbi:MAG: DUF1501 domain-containing protein [Planctomycetales bacterium]|nr:DUF1501 domain-containing protein [Planctomycetales bacterium]
MLTFVSSKQNPSCDGASRRDFLRVGSLGLAGLSLPNLWRARALANQGGQSIENKSVIWIWLSGGPTHIETFDPKMTAPSEYRSILGEAKTPLPGVTLGGCFPRMASVADKMAIVRSFAHGNSSHGSATTWVMTGYNDRLAMKPSLGSIVAKTRGLTHPDTGMPTYVGMGNLRSGGPGWLGAAYKPFDPQGQARKNMNEIVAADRLGGRRGLLHELDSINRRLDASGMMEGIDGFEQQAFELITGSARDAFDVQKEDRRLRDRYGKGLGENLLKARRLCEAGCGFVTISYGGWDMHGGIEKGMKKSAGQLDQGVSALVSDLDERGMLDDTLVVVTGEFGRTPRINKKGGRDHWGRLCTLALAGGGLHMGQVIGESSPRAEVPASTAVLPQDLMATILRMFAIDHRVQVTDNRGRPTYLIEDGRPIPELV